MLVFEERGKPEYPEKNLSEQGREPTTNSTHIWRQRWDLNPGHIGGRLNALTTAPSLLFPKTLKLIIAFLVFACKTASFIAQISSFENVLKQTPSWLWSQNSE